MSIATELTALSGHITNAYDAVQTKGGTIPTNKNMANLDDAILSIQSSTDIVNGIVKQYKASANNISADTFVEFVDSGIGVSSSATIATGVYKRTSYTGYGIQVCKLSQNKIFVLVGTAYAYHLSAAIVTIENGEVSATGELTEIVSTNYTGASVQMASLSENKVFLIYSRGSTSWSSSLTTYCKVCEISGSTITAGEEVQLMSTSGSGLYISATALDSTRVFVSMLSGRAVGICTVSGNAVSVGEITTHDATSSTGETKSALVDTNKVILLYRGKYISLCTISGSSVTVGTPLTMSYSTYTSTSNLPGQTAGFYVSSPEEVVLLYRESTSTRSTQAQTLLIDGTSLSFGAKTGISELNNDLLWYGGAVGEGSDRVFLAGVPNNGSLRLVFLALVGETVIVVQSNLVTSTGTDNRWALTSLTRDSTFVVSDKYVASNRYDIYADEIAPVYNIQESQTKVNGVTIDGITTSAAGDIWAFADDIIYNGDADTRRF